MSASLSGALNVPNHSKYQVAESGQIWSQYKNDYKVHQISNKGYPYVFLKDDDGNYKAKLVHRAVAETYLPNPDNLPEVHHKDHDPMNCHVSNLKWVTHAENMALKKENKNPARPKKKREDLPCLNRTCRKSYQHMKDWIGKIPSGKLFTGYHYKSKRFNSLTAISKAYKVSVESASQWFKLGKVRVSLDYKPQPLTPRQEKYLTRAKNLEQIKRDN
jgi:hypothetical protein